MIINFRNFFLKIFKQKYIFTIFFDIFCFGWNPKTSLTGEMLQSTLENPLINASKILDLSIR